MVAKTFHGSGIVVPVDKNNVGYRELPETDGKPENLSQPLTVASVWEKMLLLLCIMQHHYQNVIMGDKTVRL